jgi:hypothetical protein
MWSRGITDASDAFLALMLPEVGVQRYAVYLWSICSRSVALS